MIDVHSHILPGIDDGASCIEQAIEMAKIAQQENITKIISTPHYLGEGQDASKESILKAAKLLNQSCVDNGIDIDILVGQELYANINLLEDIKNNNVLPLANTDFLLIEFPMMSLPSWADDILHGIMVLGYKPVIAHPERYGYVINNPDIVKEWINMGCFTQINSMSITGRFGSKVQKVVKELATRDMIHLLGTDSHSHRGRSPKVQDSISLLKNWIGTKDAKMVVDNGFRLLENQELVTKVPQTKRNKFVSFLKRIL
ncbi:CpsB/CapC family capsule biosynthesis tyrosine phosphatase [Proteinivorax tanatarense]|uniref:protein-tyrosine-phosphatase n=1 Tax=Proteinivorax tanatarense TaxID=1260629 RepID=A0AAU7VQI9_9FIRM